MRSQRLRLSDARAVYRLLGEVQELGQDLDGWRRHMLQGLCRLTGGHVAFTVDERGFHRGAQPQMLRPIEVGWPSESARQVRLRYMAEGRVDDDPSGDAWMALVLYRRFVLALRQHLTDDATWYGSAHFNEVRKASGLDSCLTCSYGWPQLGCFSGVTLNRSWGEKQFGLRELRIVRLFQTGLFRLLLDQDRRGPDQGLHDSDELSPRLRQVLAHLRQGLAEKQIASALSLSAHTVHDYVKSLYRHLGVRSRGELMALHAALGTHGQRRIVPPPGWVPAP